MNLKYTYAILSVLNVLIHLERRKHVYDRFGYQDRRPLYEQVEEKFRNLILMGVLEPGSRMPSVRQLAMELSINPNTIQRAYMQLEQEGLIYPVKGTGNFIADSEEVRKLSKASYIKELKTLIRKGKAMGMEAEELIYIIRECYKEEKP